MYLAVMFFFTILGISLMAIGQQWSVITKRDREAELAFRGFRIQEAIARYAADYEVFKASRATRYPLTLEALTKKPRRYLPVVYKDPITGEDFELITVGKEIRGVRSRSLEKPLDRVTFKGAPTYHAFKFEASDRTPCRMSALNSPMFTPCPPTSIQRSPQSTKNSKASNKEGPA
ncbi:MAG: hypothetical protein D6704_04535 [Nitrospirae bacterium]|nr:MAG: hypothetical protein D6704_04535 [Nitrospirota bacterium]